MPWLDILRQRHRQSNEDESNAPNARASETGSHGDGDSDSDIISGNEPHSDCDHPSESDKDCEAEELAAFRRRARTEKARAAALVAREKRKMASTTVVEHPAKCFQPDLQPQPEINKPGNFSGVFHRRRWRVVYSWFRAWCASLSCYLKDLGSSASHCFTITVADDSNFVLSEVVEGAPQWRLSRVISVMNIVQAMVVAHQHEDDTTSTAETGCECHEHGTHRAFLVHTPMICVPKTDAASLGLELRSWLLSFLGRVGRRFQLFGLEEGSFAHVPIQGTFLCHDALVTNMAVLKSLRVKVHAKHQEEGYAILHPLLATKCALHQCSLLRKPSIFHFPHLWSSITRLSHLFEISSFRRHFKGSLIAIICSNFRVVHCSHLPSEAKEWRHARNSLCGLYSNDPSYPHKRRMLHLRLSSFDNADPHGLDFGHYCRGTCCKGRTRLEKEFFALVQTCRLYVLLFAQGFAVPLLYRWVHGHKALMFVKELWPWLGICQLS